MNNISKEIKDLSKVISIFCIILSIISGIALFVVFITSEILVFLFLSIIVIVIGSFGAWVLNCLIYGFGQLIENTAAIVENTKSTDESQKTLDKTSDSNWTCPHCGHSNPQNALGCENCHILK
jgi:hypothetical protein